MVKVMNMYGDLVMDSVPEKVRDDYSSTSYNFRLPAVEIKRLYVLQAALDRDLNGM